MACYGNGFVDTDLNTWGSKQFKRINTSYLKAAKEWYTAGKTWADWFPFQGDKLSDAISSVITSSNKLYYYLNIDPFPKVTADLKDVLAKGVHYYIKVNTKKTEFFKGSTDFEVKGII